MTQLETTETSFTNLPAFTGKLRMPEQEQTPTLDELKDDFQTIIDNPQITECVFVLDLEGTTIRKSQVYDSPDETLRYLNPRRCLHNQHDVNRSSKWNANLFEVINSLLDMDPDTRTAWGSTLLILQNNKRQTDAQLLRRGKFLDADASNAAAQVSVLSDKLHKEPESLTDIILKPGAAVIFINDDTKDGLPPPALLNLLRQKQPQATINNLSIFAIKNPEFTGQKPQDSKYKSELYTAIHKGLTSAPKKLHETPASRR